MLRKDDLIAWPARGKKGAQMVMNRQAASSAIRSSIEISPQSTRPASIGVDLGFVCMGFGLNFGIGKDWKTQQGLD